MQTTVPAPTQVSLVDILQAFFKQSSVRFGAYRKAYRERLRVRYEISVAPFSRSRLTNSFSRGSPIHVKANQIQTSDELGENISWDIPIPGAVDFLYGFYIEIEHPGELVDFEVEFKPLIQLDSILRRQSCVGLPYKITSGGIITQARSYSTSPTQPTIHQPGGSIYKQSMHLFSLATLPYSARQSFEGNTYTNPEFRPAEELSDSDGSGLTLNDRGSSTILRTDSSTTPLLPSSPTLKTDSSFSSRSSPSQSSFVSARSRFSSFRSSSNRITRLRAIGEDAGSLANPMKQLYENYQSALQKDDLLEPMDREVNWSGKGQHVTFVLGEDLPLIRLMHLGASSTANVDMVLCRRIALARKMMRCSRQWGIYDALREVNHLHKMRHAHIVQLVGSYLQGRNFAILMYPVAASHFGTFLEDTANMNRASGSSTKNTQLEDRKNFIIQSFYCLTSAVDHIHSCTTKHMDIKPQNILVKRVPCWHIYIADFGLSRNFRLQDDSQTDGPTSRTPRYCAPEVFHYKLRGRSADIFSLGCVFTEMFTVVNGGHTEVFADFRKGESDDESFHANLDRVFRWLLDTETEPELPPQLHHGAAVLRNLIRSMLKREPRLRPTTTDILETFTSESLRTIKNGSNCCTAGPEAYVAYDPSQH